MMRAVTTPPDNSQGGVSPDRAAELMYRIADGDRHAYEEFVRSVGPFVFGRALRVVSDRSLAEDVTQTVLATVWTKADRFHEGRGNLFAWLQTLTRNAAVDLLRVEGRHRRNSAYLLDGARIETTELGDNLDREHSSRMIKDALAQLGESQRKAIELAYFEDLSYVEVAERLGEPEGTVKSRIRRGMQQMARLVGDEHE